MKPLLALTLLAAAGAAAVSPAMLALAGVCVLLLALEALLVPRDVPGPPALWRGGASGGPDKPAGICPACHRPWRDLDRHLVFVHGEVTVGWLFPNAEGESL